MNETEAQVRARRWGGRALEHTFAGLLGPTGSGVLKVYRRALKASSEL